MARRRIIARGLCGLVAAVFVAHRSPSAAARRDLPRLEAFPATHEALPTNGRIVLDRDLSRLELRAGEERIPLRHGPAVGRHSVYVPATELKPRTRYVLFEAEEREPLRDGPEFVGGGKVLEWTTGPGPDHVAPRWSAAPTAVAGNARRSTSADILAPVAGNELVRIIAEIRPLDHGRSKVGASRVLLSGRGLVSLGYAETGGELGLEPGHRYTVKLTAVDAAGNEARAPGPPVEIVGPDRPTLKVGVVE